jgi:transglutaminase-like putative cysteine protease
MATATQTTGAGEQRGFLVGALLSLGAATGLAFGRVFQGPGATLRLMVAGVLAVGLAEAFRRRHVLLSVAVGAAGLLLALSYFVSPDTLWYGLPSLDTLRATREAVSVLGQEAIREVAPAPPLQSLMTASITAVWTAATASHALAVRSRSTLLPLLPPAALLAFAGVVTGDGPRPGYVAILLVAGMAVVFAVGVDRLGVWGRIVRRPERRLVGSTTSRGAAWIGAGALGVALVLPGILPGYRSGSVLPLPGRPGSVSINPFVDIRPRLRRNPARELLVVDAARPAYWRMMALDRFDGRVWSSSDIYAENGAAVRGPQGLYGTTSGPQGLYGTYRPGVPLEQTIEVRQLAGAWLPTAFEATDILLPPEEVLRWDREASVLVRPEGVEEGFTYEVTSNLVAPTAGELARAYEGDDRPGPDEARYLALPPGLPDRIAQITERIVSDAGATNPHQEILAIQEFLREFTYDERVSAGHGTNDILRFLEQTRRGYCEQFAGTMAVMVRTLGYPSRVAVGFLPGNRDRDGRFHVNTKHAHAWPEVFFPTYGWLGFEPTPTRDNPVAAPYLAPPGAGDRPGSRGPGGGGQGDDASGIFQREEFNATGSTFQEAPEAPSRPEEAEATPWGAIVLALLAAVAVVAAFAAAAKTVARAVALSRRGSPAAVVHIAYRVLEASAADLRLGRRPAETLGEFRDRLRGNVPFSDGHLERVMSLAGTAMYAPRHPGPEEARDAVAAARATVHDLRRHAGPLRTVLGAVRPSPPL